MPLRLFSSVLVRRKDEERPRRTRKTEMTIISFFFFFPLPQMPLRLFSYVLVRRKDEEKPRRTKRMKKTRTKKDEERTKKDEKRRCDIWGGVGTKEVQMTKIQNIESFWRYFGLLGNPPRPPFSMSAWELLSYFGKWTLNWDYPTCKNMTPLSQSEIWIFRIWPKYIWGLKKWSCL